MSHNPYACKECRAAMLEILFFLSLALFLMAFAWSAA